MCPQLMNEDDLSLVFNEQLDYQKQQEKRGIKQHQNADYFLESISFVDF